MNKKYRFRGGTLISLALLLCCVLASGSGADSEPERVMGFIAVMDLKCGAGIDKEACASLTDILIEELVKIGKSSGKFSVIDRANRDKILSEQGFQQTGCVDERCTVEAGRLLGVGLLVVGSISRIGDTYVVNIQLINVQTAAVENASSETCRCKIDELIGSVRKVAGALMSQAPTAENQGLPSPGETMSIETARIAEFGLFKSYDKSKAMVIFYWPNKKVPFGHFPPSLYDGDKKIGTITDGKYLYYETDPGIHNFHSGGVPPVVPFKLAPINLIAGKAIFIEVKFVQKYTYAVRFELALMQPSIGIIEAKKCKHSG